MAYYLAIDIGASSGRHILGHLENGTLILEEVYRFKNGMTERNGHLCWDTTSLFREIKAGLKACKDIGKIPVSLSIDTWGVDFVLIDSDGQMIGDSVGYRDHRTDSILDKMNAVVSQAELYDHTGISFQPYNTINQLVALKEQAPEQLDKAKSMLMTPDYYNYLLTGVAKQEYTIASTGQLLNAETGTWDTDIIGKCGLPRNIFNDPEMPGTVVGALNPEVVQEVGFDCTVIMAASHDTASAVMAVPSLEENTLYISSGTWSLMGCETMTPIKTSAAMDAGFTNEGGYNKRYRFLKNIMGLWMIQSVREEIGKEYSFDEICKMAAKETISSIVDCNDISFLSPASMVEAVQTYCKSTNQPIPQTLAELACVIYNSLAKCYARAKREIEALTGKIYEKIFIIGGGSQAEYLNALTACYAECTVSAGPTEATAIGNILCQMLKSGEFKTLEEARSCVIKSFQVKFYN